MKFMSAFLLVALFAATAHGLGVLFNPLPPARYGPPRLLSNFSSKLFNPNQTTGTSPIFDLINTLTSRLYGPIASAINQAFLNNTGIGNILNFLTGNFFGGGFCAFPPATTQAPLLPGQTQSPTMAPTASTNPAQWFFNLINGGGGNSGATGSPGSSGGGSDLSTIINNWMNSGSSGTGSSGSGTSNSSNTNVSGIVQILQQILAGQTSGSGSGTSTIPNVPQTSVSDLANQLGVSPTDLTNSLNSCGVTATQLASAINQTHSDFHQMLANANNNLTAAVQNLLNQLAQSASPAVQSLANALNTTLANLCLSALQANIPVSNLNEILSKLSLTAQAYLSIYITSCNQNYPCFFRQLSNLFSNSLANGGSGSGNGLGNTVTGGLNDLTQKLGPVGDLLNNVVGGLLSTVNGLLGKLLGG